jgi:hypothetical protein
MSSTAQTLANQKNAQLSTGPRTEAGKQKASLNSTRHGFTGQVVVLTAEEAEPYRLFNESFMQDLDPQGSVEQQLARNIIDAYWRINKIHSTESAIYALGHREYAEQFAGETPEIAAAMARALTFENKRQELDRLNRYESRLQRQVSLDYARLRQLQKTRISLENKQEDHAIAIHRNMTKQGKSWNPAEFGFVWSIAEIESLMRLRKAHDEAQCPPMAA